MADASQLQLSPYALFDPTQWSNPYSNYQSSPLPGASYVGTPTNYAGQPIQMPAGMTINQTPSQPAAAAAPQGNGQTMQQVYQTLGYQPVYGQAGRVSGQQIGVTPATNPNQALINAIYQGGGQSGGGFGGQGSGTSFGSGAMLESLLNQGGGGAPAQQAAQPAPASSGGLTPQQYMAMRANPGPVPTYGATVPQSASSAQPGTGVLQSFLANWKPAQSGVGSGFQQGFSQALKGMGYS